MTHPAPPQPETPVDPREHLARLQMHPRVWEDCSLPTANDYQKELIVGCYEMADKILAAGYRLAPDHVSIGREAIAQWLYESNVGGNGGPGSWEWCQDNRMYPIPTSMKIGEYYRNAADDLLAALAKGELW